MEIRAEKKSDYKEIYDMVFKAFQTAEHADGNEQDLVNALRNGNAYIPELSLVAVMNDKIVGHIMFTKMQIGESKVLALAPLSVMPGYQRQKIGTRLIMEGHKRAAEMGYVYSVVLGSDLYYPRFGYQQARSFGVEAPDGIPDNFFMICKLDQNADPIGGKIKYADEFGV